MWNTILNAVKTFFLIFLKDKCKEILAEVIKEIKEHIWEIIKKEITEAIQETISIIKAYLDSNEGKAKKEAIATIIFEKVKLPVLLRPFKGLIKKKFSDKIDELTVEILRKAEGIKL